MMSRSQSSGMVLVSRSSGWAVMFWASSASVSEEVSACSPWFVV